MKIGDVNGLKAAKDFFDLPKKREIKESRDKGDRVEISAEAKSYASSRSLLNLVSEYLEKVPDVRPEQVEIAREKISDGYTLEREKLEVIAEKILKNFGI